MVSTPSTANRQALAEQWMIYLQGLGFNGGDAAAPASIAAKWRIRPTSDWSLWLLEDHGAMFEGATRRGRRRADHDGAGGSTENDQQRRNLR